MSELPDLAALQIERPEFQGVLVIGGVDDPAPVGGAVGLIVVARTGRQLLCAFRGRPPAPKGAAGNSRATDFRSRWDEHTSELQSRGHIACSRPLDKNMT